MACRALQCLPVTGGLYDQPFDLAEGMLMVLDAVNQKQIEEMERATK